MISLTFSIKKTSNNQRELYMHVRIFGKLVVSRRVFRCHAKQHKVIRDVLCALRFWVWRKPVALIPATVTTPAASVGATETFKALAEKSRTAAASKPKRKLDSKSLASFNNSPRQGKGVRYHSSYGDGMRKVKAEAGI